MVNIVGKTYSLGGNLEYEDSILNGIFHGEGKLYDSKWNTIFEGEYMIGKRWNGKGKEKIRSTYQLIYAIFD